MFVLIQRNSQVTRFEKTMYISWLRQTPVPFVSTAQQELPLRHETESCQSDTKSANCSFQEAAQQFKGVRPFWVNPAVVFKQISYQNKGTKTRWPHNEASSCETCLRQARPIFFNFVRSENLTFFKLENFPLIWTAFSTVRQQATVGVDLLV